MFESGGRREIVEMGKSSAGNYICFAAFGVRIAVKSRSAENIEEIEAMLKTLLPGGFERAAYEDADHIFEIEEDRSGKYLLYQDGKEITFRKNRSVFFQYVGSLIRLTVAEYADDKVFLHAGVVGWKGRAIVIPGRSFRGKTTLVKELIKNGAIYYSDEYAVLDENGAVHPFPKALSVRGLIGEYIQTDIPVEYWGGIKGTTAIPVGMIFLTEYQINARWRPRVLSGGRGVLELLSHTIPIRYNPEFSLKVLNKTATRAIIVKTKRGEAKDFSLKILKYFEDNAF